MDIFGRADFVEMPWKNGLGTTLQLLIEPKEADLSTFDWRISIASVTASSPFSAFPGCDRTLVLLDGPGFDILTKEEVHFAREPLKPVLFSGDEPSGCTLYGPSRDFNVMCRRDRVSATVEVARCDGRMTLASTASTFVIVCIDGSVRIGGVELTGLALARTEAGSHLAEGQGTLILVHLSKRG